MIQVNGWSLDNRVEGTSNFQESRLENKLETNWASCPGRGRRAAAMALRYPMAMASTKPQGEEDQATKTQPAEVASLSAPSSRGMRSGRCRASLPKSSAPWSRSASTDTRAL